MIDTLPLAIRLLLPLALNGACFQTDPIDLGADAEAGDPDVVADARVDDIASCPTVAIVAAEGREVIPQTVLHLSAAAAASEAGAYHWEVSQPPGSTATLVPSAEATAVSLEANVAGRYVFRLATPDGACPPVEHEVWARPTVAVHIELLWAAEPAPPVDDTRDPARDDLVLTTSHTAITFDPLGNDVAPPGATLMVTSIESAPNFGEATLLADGRLRYEPFETFAGTDIFLIDIGDQHGARWLSRVLVYVDAPGNTRPDARDDRFTVAMDGRFDATAALANDRDADGDTLRFGLDWPRPRHGKFEVAIDVTGASFSYMPDTGYVGTDRFEYSIDDGRGGYDTAIVEVVVGDPTPGADLDLHLLDATSGATWFDPHHDSYWDSPWSSADPESSPRLDRDDTDGDGPENMNLASLSPGDRYCIGVHAWDDFGRGASNATVRVYFDGALTFERDQRLVHDDLWEVGCIDRDGGTPRVVETLDDGVQRVIPGYRAR